MTGDAEKIRKRERIFPEYSLAEARGKEYFQREQVSTESNVTRKVSKEL